jgi:hypothetical protein
MNEKMTTVNLVTSNIINLYWWLSLEHLNDIKDALNEEPIIGNLNNALAFKYKKHFIKETDTRFIELICDEFKVVKLIMGVKECGVKTSIVNHECCYLGLQYRESPINDLI